MIETPCTVIASALKWLIYVAICLTLVIVIVLGYKDYKEIKKEREEMKITNQNFYSHNCMNQELISKNGVANACHSTQHSLEEDPAEYAIYEVLASWSIFPNWSLTKSVRFTQNAGMFSMVELVGTGMFLAILILLSVGMCMCSRMYASMSINGLPTFHSQPPEYPRNLSDIMTIKQGKQE